MSRQRQNRKSQIANEITDRASLSAAIRRIVPGLSAKQTDAWAKVVDAQAEVFARLTRRPKRSWYDTFIADAKRGPADGNLSGALLQQGDNPQTRSDAFKQWFGDWEAAGRLAGLRSMEAIEIDSTPMGDPADAKAMRAAGRAAFLAAMRRAQSNPIENRHDGRRITLNNRGFKEVRQHSADTRVMRVMAKIDTLLTEAMPLWSSPDRSGELNIRAWHVYGAKVDLDGEPGYVKLSVREDTNGNFFYDGDFNTPEMIEGPPQPPALIPNQAVTATDLPENSIGQWAAKINENPASKVVDDQGRPLVVYHGTGAEFTEFVENPFRYNAEQGFFFTDSPGEAAEFAAMRGHGDGDNLIAVYLSLSDPSIVDYGGEIYTPDRFEASIREAQKQLRDGVIIRNIQNFEGGPESTTYIVFDSEQIKSAIGNRGTFDGTDPNILHQDVDPADTAPTFYSALRRLIEEKMPNRASGQMLRGLVSKGQIKADELKWTGFDEWLSQQTGPVTKQQVLDFLDANAVRVEEVQKGQPRPPLQWTRHGEVWVSGDYRIERLGNGMYSMRLPGGSIETRPTLAEVQALATANRDMAEGELPGQDAKCLSEIMLASSNICGGNFRDGLAFKGYGDIIVAC